MGSPAFISDEAEEHHYLETLGDPSATPVARADARLGLARLYEQRGQFAEAAEMYERNIWAGARTPATYAGLAAAYRALGRADLAEATLEQIRRQGGAAERERPAEAGAGNRTGRRSAGAARQQPSTGEPSARRAAPAAAGAAAAGAAAAGARSLTEGLAGGATSVFGQVERAVAPFLAGRAGRRTLLASTVLLPIALGVAIFAVVVLTSARPRAAEPPPAPTPTAAPVATAAPPVAPTLPVPAALTDPPASARLVVANVGRDGLTLRRSPGTGERIKVWPEGTELADLGEQAEEGGKTWRRVRDPDGSVGWAAAEFLADPAALAPPPTPPYPSGGLGLARPDWEKVHGAPTRTSIFLEYGGGRLVVGFLENNAHHIERIWMPTEAVPLDVARNELKAYLPADASLIESADRGDGRVVDVYASPTLAGRFGASAWNGGRTGTFSIQYRFRSVGDRHVTSGMFRLGDTAF